MADKKYLVRSPLLDAGQRVLGYKLGWQNNGAPADVADFCRLVERVSGFRGDAGLGTLFLEGNPLVLPWDVLQAMDPAQTVWLIDSSEISQATFPEYLALREQGFGLALQGAGLDFLGSNEGVLSLISHLECPVQSPDRAALGVLCRQQSLPITLLCGQAAGWADFDACAALEMPVFFAALCRARRFVGASRKLNSQATLILQLMQLVRENADVRHVEKLLQQDAVLSYKLFRYINSASIGMQAEVHSLRHAVAMLGYAPLFRWLSMLLAMAGAESFSPAMLQAAIIRGRLTELLGQGHFNRSELDDLFVVGMFSLIGQMLGVEVSQLLDQIVLPEAIVQAVLSREGKYGPFIGLAEACEHEEGCADDLADLLLLTAADVNEAQLSALAWARNIRNQ
jgi:c-di-GMP-related signal transduction protein